LVERRQEVVHERLRQIMNRTERRNLQTVVLLKWRLSRQPEGRFRAVCAVQAVFLKQP
jgi:hypothetical protein